MEAKINIALANVEFEDFSSAFFNWIADKYQQELLYHTVEEIKNEN